MLLEGKHGGTCGRAVQLNGLPFATSNASFQHISLPTRITGQSVHRPPFADVANANPQHAKNNFRPRQFKRIPSSTESQAALRRTLQKYWGHKNFRGPQLDICLHALRGCDVLVIAPTGLGKS